MNFAKTLLILVSFWQFCDANEITKNLKKQVKALKTKHDSIKLFMGMYIIFSIEMEMSMGFWDILQLNFYIITSFFSRWNGCHDEICLP